MHSTKRSGEYASCLAAISLCVEGFLRPVSFLPPLFFGRRGRLIPTTSSEGLMASVSGDDGTPSGFAPGVPFGVWGDS